MLLTPLTDFTYWLCILIVLVEEKQHIVADKSLFDTDRQINRQTQRQQTSLSHRELLSQLKTYTMLICMHSSYALCFFGSQIFSFMLLTRKYLTTHLSNLPLISSPGSIRPSDFSSLRQKSWDIISQHNWRAMKQILSFNI